VWSKEEKVRAIDRRKGRDGKKLRAVTAACDGALLPIEDSFKRVPMCTCPFTSGLTARAAPVGGALRSRYSTTVSLYSI
jgi:hypothetical protein